MSSIRRQSIISSAIVYSGFALGILNTYLFTKEGGFTKAEYGLTGTFIAFASVMFSLASLGMPAYIGKFFPYYNSHLPEKKNDQLTWALLISCIGFLLVLLAGFVFKNILVDKIFNNSPELLQFYYWTFPFGFGYTIFMIMEAYAWQHRKSVLTNFLKEVLFRFLTTVLIVLTTLHFIKDFKAFIVLYAFLYLAIALFLLIYFIKKKKFHLTFSISKVTRKLYNKIIILASYIWAGGLVFNIASVFDTIIIAAVLPNGMAAVAPFLLAQNISSLIQAPQRAIISSAVGPLSQAWKEKDYKKIDKIYHHSSINQLVFSCAIFCLIWLNFEEGIHTLKLQEDYLAAKWVFFYIGLYKIIDMGTGLNSQIIGTSTFWRFEFWTGIILLSIMLPLNWQLTRYLGILGPAISNLIGFSIYNLIRYLFLWNKFKMQPFTIKSAFTILITVTSYFFTYYLFKNLEGWLGIGLRTIFFLLIFTGSAYYLKLSPDIRPVIETIKKKLRF
jgi:O-antigen/teichoic acid export membrane protein